MLDHNGAVAPPMTEETQVLSVLNAVRPTTRIAWEYRSPLLKEDGNALGAQGEKLARKIL